MGMFSNVIQGTTDYGAEYGPASDEYKKYFGEAQNYLAPYRGAGERGLKGYEDLLANPDSIRTNPGYQFRLGEGADVVQNNALAKGGYFSGNTGRALTEFGQNFATTELDKALSRFNPMLSLGYGAAGTSSANAMGAANTLSGIEARQALEADEAKRRRMAAWGDFGDSIAGMGMGGGGGGISFGG